MPRCYLDQKVPCSREVRPAPRSRAFGALQETLFPQIQRSRKLSGQAGRAVRLSFQSHSQPAGKVCLSWHLIVIIGFGGTKCRQPHVFSSHQSLLQPFLHSHSSPPDALGDP